MIAISGEITATGAGGGELHSFNQADVRGSDHHAIGLEFQEFCPALLNQGQDPQAEWVGRAAHGWLVQGLGTDG